VHVNGHCTQKSQNWVYLYVKMISTASTCGFNFDCKTVPYGDFNPVVNLALSDLYSPKTPFCGDITAYDNTGKAVTFPLTFKCTDKGEHNYTMVSPSMKCVSTVDVFSDVKSINTNTRNVYVQFLMRFVPLLTLKYGRS
jgi:hypothetical protein